MPKAKYIGYLILIIIVLGIPLTYFFGDIVTKYMEDQGYLVPWEDAYFAYLTQDSLDCIKCHGEEKEAKAVEIETEWGGKQKFYRMKSTYISPHTEIKKLTFLGIAYAATINKSTSNHPVGIPYPIGDWENYNNPTKCSEIILPSGYVECESCHNITPHGSVKCEDNKSSKLCLGCHNK